MTRAPFEITCSTALFIATRIHTAAMKRSVNGPCIVRTIIVFLYDQYLHKSKHDVFVLDFKQPRAGNPIMFVVLKCAC